MSRRPLRVAAVAVALTIVAVACGLPSDGEPHVVAPDRVPEELASSPETGSTLASGPDDEVANVYVFDEEGNRLQAIAVPADDGGAAAVLALLDGPELTDSQSNFVPSSLELEGYQLLDSDKVLLELSAGLEEVEGETQARAVAQLVYTVAAAEPRAKSLVIEVDGTAIELPDDSGASADVVWTDDYAIFLFPEE